ncbi:hypothetical protein Lal_00001287 [Lupinus albus]|nr:hypothetical protein Lal_00001287 [Lupinus albus]
MQTYIVYTGSNIKDESSALSFYTSMLQEVADSNAKPKSVMHHYKRSFGGFIVKLTEEEADRMAELDGVVSVFPNEKKQLHTTRSWDFIGFPQQVKRETTESDVIIGVIDTGIWPESYSFDDKGFGPPPSKWKGTCQTYNFTCNNKIIGAKCYRTEIDDSFPLEDLKSPRDAIGHGTHTASTAAGNPIGMASLLGLGQGTARGGAPSARIAVYKVCWEEDCAGVDILAAFDDAIADGKWSIDSTFSREQGPTLSSLSNFSPWSVSVAASTIDRKFVTKVELGDNKTFEGTSLNTFDLKGKLYPIIYGGDAPNTKGGIDGSVSRFCLKGTLDKKLVKGKIVLYDGETSAKGAFLDGAVGALMETQYFKDVNRVVSLPASYLDLQDGAYVYNYINSTRTPTATIFKSEELKDTSAPIVVFFSSRGPNLVTPEILKSYDISILQRIGIGQTFSVMPDITAPGVNILASWTPISHPHVESDDRTLLFNIISGTSMSCPHVSGVAAYIKSFHPTWSPAAIRSALMTTATQLSPKTNRDAEFAYGAGQIDPSKAINPGLVYEANEIDYVRFLCGQGYSTRTLQLITGDNSSCTETTYKTARDLNYPSFALSVLPSKTSVSGSFNRTVTNVGLSSSTYKAIVNAPQGLKIKVHPNVLSFNYVGQKQKFVLTIEGTLEEYIVSGSLVWDDGKFQVRSPIVVFNAP